MNQEDWFKSKWRYMKRFSYFAIAGITFGILAALTKIEALAAGMLLILPLLFWLVFVPLLHWKDRYIGEKGTIWGALILIETSGCSKIVYWFRHILPDWKKEGRYSDVE